MFVFFLDWAHVIKELFKNTSTDAQWKNDIFAVDNIQQTGRMTRCCHDSWSFDGLAAQAVF